MKFGSPPVPRTCLAPRLAYCTGGKLLTSFTVSDMASGLSVEVGCGSAGLVSLMGKYSVSNITVPLSFAIVPKALAMPRYSVVATPFTILPPPPSLFRPLAPYCPMSWHLSPSNPPQLTPYCPLPAGTLLLISDWHPTATRRWLASPLPGGSARPPFSHPPAI